MEKRDLIIVAVGIIIVLIMAVFVKPMITGEEVQFFPESNESFIKNVSQQEENISALLNETPPAVNQEPELIPTLPPTPNATPTAVPTWDKSQTIMELQSETGTYIFPRAYPTNSVPDRKMLTYSTMSGKTSGITKPVSIPYGYWELQYDIKLPEDLTNAEIESGTLIRTKEEALAKTASSSEDSNVVSLSVVSPRFSITVRDASTGTILRKITPEGGLNPKLWTEDDTYVDPRPWTEKFFSGGDFIFDIDSYFIDEYTILILVPNPDDSTSAGAGYKKEKSDVLHLAFIPYQELINADVYKDTYISNITAILSPVARNNLQTDTEYKTLITDRLSGATLDSLLVGDEWVQGNHGELTGSVIWQIQNNTITSPVTLSFSRNQEGIWQLDSLVYLSSEELIRYLMKEYQTAFNSDYSNDTYATAISDLVTEAVRDEYALIQCNYGEEQGKCCAFKDPYCESSSRICTTSEDCSLQAIYRTCVTNRLQGVTMKEFIPSDTAIQGSKGVLKGEIIWDVHGIVKRTYNDIPIKKDNGWVWQLDTLIVLRS